MRSTHNDTLSFVEPLTDGELRASPAVGAPSIGFHVWHVARWADLLQSRLASMTQELADRLGERDQIWLKQNLAAAWRFPAGSLGEMESGMGMDEDISVSLPLPSKDILLVYAREAFGALEETIEAAGGHLDEPCIDLYGRTNTLAGVVLKHMRHTNRHLGMIEALIGIHGRSGTTTL